MSMTKINDKKSMTKNQYQKSMAKNKYKKQIQKTITMSMTKIKKIKLLLKLYVNLRFLFPSTD
jgi:putative cell wall-binding protein